MCESAHPYHIVIERRSRPRTAACAAQCRVAQGGAQGQRREVRGRRGHVLHGRLAGAVRAGVRAGHRRRRAASCPAAMALAAHRHGRPSSPHPAPRAHRQGQAASRRVAGAGEGHR